MQTMRWTNPSQPQTLQIGVFLLYFDAFWSVLGALSSGGIGVLIQLAFAALYAAAGWGIANEKKAWYWAGIVISAIGIIPILFIFQIGLSLPFLIGLVFPLAQFVALVHPMSRSYAKIWFS